MPSWSELLRTFEQKRDTEPDWLNKELINWLAEVSKLRKGTTIILYASAFLQKDHVDVSIAPEDMNGFMNALHGANIKNDLPLILHTPGGNPNNDINLAHLWAPILQNMGPSLMVEAEKLCHTVRNW